MAQAPYHHGDLREALLTHAAEIVETEGIAALTLRELSRRLGVSHAAPANHFADKATLIAELAVEGFEALTECLQEAVAKPRTPTAQLKEAGRAYVRFALAHPGHFRVMFGRGLESAAPSARLVEAGDRAFAALEGPVAATLDSRSPEKLRQAAFLAWAVVHGAAMLILDGPIAGRLGDDKAVRALVDHATAAVAESIAGKP